jgi:hypothetical protein
MRQPSAKQRVLKGCKLLDRKEPGWANRIDLTKFHLWNPYSCVLGQLHGDYYEALPIFHLVAADDFPLSRDENAAMYGFESSVEDYDADNEYALLERHWRLEIVRRQRESQS